MKYPEYYKCIKCTDSDASFTRNKIYKIVNPEDLEDISNFIDDNGACNGWAGNNHEHFEPSTIEEWNIQEGIYTKPKVEEDYSYLIPLLTKLNEKWKN